jgi:hypothetical protein
MQRFLLSFFILYAAAYASDEKYLDSLNIKSLDHLNYHLKKWHIYKDNPAVKKLRSKLYAGDEIVLIHQYTKIQKQPQKTSNIHQKDVISGYKYYIAPAGASGVKDMEIGYQISKNYAAYLAYMGIENSTNDIRNMMVGFDKYLGENFTIGFVTGVSELEITKSNNTINSVKSKSYAVGVTTKAFLDISPGVDLFVKYSYISVEHKTNVDGVGFVLEDEISKGVMGIKVKY